MGMRLPICDPTIKIWSVGTEADPALCIYHPRYIAPAISDLIGKSTGP